MPKKPKNVGAGTGQAQSQAQRARRRTMSAEQAARRINNEIRKSVPARLRQRRGR